MVEPPGDLVEMWASKPHRQVRLALVAHVTGTSSSATANGNKQSGEAPFTDLFGFASETTRK
jgi:hypothetical protein